MSYKLFIDDERMPSDVTWLNVHYYDNDFIVVRNWAEVYETVIILGMPEFISFDHDLGANERTGYEICQHLCDLDMDSERNIQFPDNFTFAIHSKNPIGAENIRKYKENYLAKSKGKEYAKTAESFRATLNSTKRVHSR